jgi:hypothetical protein
MPHTITQKYIYISERNNHDVYNDLVRATNYLNMKKSPNIHGRWNCARVPDVPLG